MTIFNKIIILKTIILKNSFFMSQFDLIYLSIFVEKNSFMKIIELAVSFYLKEDILIKHI